MFGIGFEELIILAVLAFILFGPEKLPDYAATLGRFVAKMRQTSSELTQQYQNPFQYSQELKPTPASESVCPQCQQIVSQDFTFCPKCGHRLEKDRYQPPPPASACQYCQQKVDPEATFCPHCGHRLKEEHYPPPPQQPVLPETMIRPLQPDELDTALAIINQAAQAYKGVIPADCWQEPYMPEAELRAEIAAGVEFAGYMGADGLLGVMGRQNKGEVTLIRHAYVHPGSQRQGVGALLLTHLMDEVAGPVLVGTWAAACWAIRFYEKHGFKLVDPETKDWLLRTYWTISDRQVETSVVLADPRWLASTNYSG